MRSIFEYLDYREHLKDAFDAKKADSPLYSYRMFATFLGLDPSNVFRILQKDAHLPARCQARAIEFLSLSGRASEYFVLLVAYGHERKASAKQKILEQALELRDVARRDVVAAELSYFKDWWVVALRTMIEVVEGRSVPRELSARLKPSVPEAEVVKALELLQELGLVKKIASGRLALSDVHLTATAGPEKVMAVRRFQSQILTLASESLERFPPDLRDISTLTLAIDQDAFGEVREVLRECRRQIQKCAEGSRRPDRVMQLAMAFFPLSETGGRP